MMPFILCCDYGAQVLEVHEKLGMGFAPRITRVAPVSLRKALPPLLQPLLPILWVMVRQEQHDWMREILLHKLCTICYAPFRNAQCQGIKAVCVEMSIGVAASKSNLAV